MSTIYADAPKYMVVQLGKLRLTKKVRDDFKKKYDMKVWFLDDGSVRGLPVLSC